MHNGRRDLGISNASGSGLMPSEAPIGAFGYVNLLLGFVFIISTAYDRDSFPIAGAFAALVILGSLPVARLQQGKVVLSCIGMLGLWAISQFLLFEQTLAAMFRILGTLGLVFAVSAIPFNRKLAHLQLFGICIMLLALALPYYFGGYYLDGDGRWNYGGIGANILALHLVSGSFVCVYFGLCIGNLRDPGSFLIRVLSLLLIALSVIPIIATGSRKGVLLLFFVPSFFLLLRMGLKRSLFIVLLVPPLVVVSFPLVVSALELEIFDTLVFRFGEELESGVADRFKLVNQGLIAASEFYFQGHGMDAPYSNHWLAENIAYNAIGDIGISTHNAFVNYLIMGGIPIFGIFSAIYTWIGIRLFKGYFRAIDQPERDLASLAITLEFLFLYGMTGGADFWKLGWWMLGFSLWVSIYLGDDRHREILSEEGELVGGRPLPDRPLWRTRPISDLEVTESVQGGALNSGRPRRDSL
jgi:hypothetical protein